MVGLDENGMVQDFYYPYVGLDNLSNARRSHHKIGVWVDGTFCWIDDGNWEISVDFEADALISTVTMKHAKLQLELHFKDFVDYECNAFCRQIQVVNNASERREIRVFMHQVFQISRAGRADTALYVPDENYVLDYKGRVSLLIYGETTKHVPFDQYVVGNFGIEGKEGSFRDAEDGELSNNPVEHGGVDSVLRLQCHLDAGLSQAIDYWIVAAVSQHDAEKVHSKLKDAGLADRLERTRHYWNDWLKPAVDGLNRLDRSHVPMVKKSLLIIKAHTDKRGSILASGDSSIFNYGRDYYCYCWPRDGAYAIWPLIRLGFTEEPKRFFEFCRDIANEDGYLEHKFQPDRSIGSTWHPLVHNNHRELAIQEDETAIVVLMLGEFLERNPEDKEFVELLYNTFTRPAADFMANYIDQQTSLPHASYDLWEEKFLTTTYTTAATHQALLTAAKMAEHFEYPDDATRWRTAAEAITKGMPLLFDQERQAYRKGLLIQPDGNLQFDNTLDVSSLYGMLMFGPEDVLEELHDTAHAIEQDLLDHSPSGGSPRYENDRYMCAREQYKGNPWFVTTLWLAQYYIQMRDMPKAAELVNWTMQRALPSGALSEQIDPEDSSTVGVAPLVWSHAEFINTVLDLAKV